MRAWLAALATLAACASRAPLYIPTAPAAPVQAVSAPPDPSGPPPGPAVVLTPETERPEAFPSPPAAPSPGPKEAPPDPRLAWVRDNCQLTQPHSYLEQRVCNPVCPPKTRVWPCPEYTCPAGANPEWVAFATEHECAIARGSEGRGARVIDDPNPGYVRPPQPVKQWPPGFTP